MAGEFEKGAKIARWEQGLQSPEAALRQVGAMMVAQSQRAFVDQRFGSKAWKPRKVPNVLGIIADFAAGKKTPPNRRFEAQPVLRDTGRLMQSIAARMVGQDVVEVGSNLDYAGLHHGGGETQSKPITEQVATSLADWLRGPGKPWQKALGWILNRKFRGKTIASKIHERPIVGITQQLVKDVEEVVAVKIMEAK